ncbi:MAG: DUF488 family protein [Candidatus Rokuibacteriota bacterium]
MLATGLMIVLTIGHSTRRLEELIGLLHQHGVEMLVDVRTVPRSRRHPQFDRETLPDPLRAAGIGYEHLRALGGLRRSRPDSINTAWQNAGFRGYADHMQTEEFEAALVRLLEVARHARTAVMCAEAVPWRCHRSLVADALVARGVTVEHILSPTRREAHRLTPWARVDGTRVTYPALA